MAFTHESADGLIRVGAIFDGHGAANCATVARIARDCLREMLAAHSHAYSTWSAADWQRALGLGELL